MANNPVSGTPVNLRFRVETSPGSFTSIKPLRHSIKFEPAEPGRPRKLTFKIHRINGPVNLHEWQEIRVDDPYTNPSAPYPRYFGGFITDTGDQSEEIGGEYKTITCQDYNILFTRGTAQIGNGVDIGGYTIWSPGLTVTQDMVIVPINDNDHQYTAQNAGTTGGSQPSFPTGPGSTVNDNGIVWQESGRPRRTDKQAFEYIIQTYLPECSTAANLHIHNLTRFTIKDETLESAFGKLGVQAASNSYPIAAASTNYPTVGKMLRANPPNDSYYEVTTAGTTTGSSPGVWTTIPGGTVTWGTVVLTCRGSTTMAPFAAIYPSPDNMAHNAAWNKVAGWYDLLSWTEIPLLTVEFQDITVEDATHIRYNSDATRNRDASQYRNKQTVVGNLGARGTKQDTVSQAYVNGRVVTGPTIKDDKLTENVQCENAAAVVLGALGYARETIGFSSYKVPGDPIDILLAPRRVKFSKATWGLSHEVYFIVGVGLDFSEDVAKWTYQLGSAPQTLGENGLPRAMMGARYVSNLDPPGSVTWDPATYVVSNVWNYIHHLTEVVVQWRPPTTGQGDLAIYNVRVRDVISGTYIRNVRQGADDVSIWFMGTPSSNYVVEVQSEDIWGNRSAWSSSPMLTTAGITVTTPPTITNTKVGRASNGQYYVEVVVAHTGDHAAGGWINWHLNGPGPGREPVPIPANFTSPVTVRVAPLAPHNSYDLEAIVVSSLGVPSLPSTPVTVIVNPLPAPPPPSWDSYHPDDPTWRGQKKVAGVDADFTWETSSTHLDNGATVRRIACTSGSSNIEASLPEPCYPGEKINFKVRRKQAQVLGSGGSSPRVKSYVRWYDQTVFDPAHANYGNINAHLSESTIYDNTATTSYIEDSIKLTAPASARAFRTLIRHYDNGGVSGTWHAWFAQPRALREVTQPQIGSGAVGDAELTTLTDPTKHRYNVETNPLDFHNASAQYVGRLQYNNGTDTLTLSTDNVVLATDLYLKAGLLGELILDGGGGVRSLANHIMEQIVFFGAAKDTNLYRASANKLKTDDDLEVAGSLIAGLSGLTGTISDAQHGSRGGGSLHANAVAGGAAGFMPGGDKTKVDSIAYQSLTDGSVISWNTANGNGTVTINGNRYLQNPIGMVAGQRYFLRVKQDATGSRRLTFGTAYRWENGGVAPTLSTAANAEDLFVFESDGTYMYCVRVVLNLVNTLPSTIANLHMWLKADALTGLANNDPVTTWTDSSGNGRNGTQTTASKKPLYKTNQINGLPSLFFDATDDGMTTTSSLTGAYTAFCVWRTQAASGNRRAIQGAVNNWLMGPYNGLNQLYNGSFINGGTASANTWYYATGYGSPGSAGLYVNGVLTTGGSSTAPGQIDIGGAVGAFAEPLNGDIAEIIVYSAVLTAAQIEIVHAYIRSKYNL